MSAVVPIRFRPMPLPTLVSLKIADFLASGRTGKIVLNVKEGRVLAYELTEAGRVPALDQHPCVGQDSID